MDRDDKSAREMAFIQSTISRLPRTVTSYHLLTTEFPPIKWIIPGFLTPGLTILAGNPKLGKSWMVLGMAHSVAVDGFVFGRLKVQGGEVLLLALEDTPRRLQYRLDRIQATGSERLHIATEWPKGREAATFIDAWMLQHPDTVAIFIDTLQRISAVEDNNDYRQTYEATNLLKQVADRHGIAVLVVHHTTKGGDDGDFVHRVSGSVGLTGAADTVITMTRPRGQRDGILRVTGRDVGEGEYGVRFDSDVGTWVMMDRMPSTPSMRSSVDGKMLAAGEEGGEA